MAVGFLVVCDRLTDLSLEGVPMGMGDDGFMVSLEVGVKPHPLPDALVAMGKRSLGQKMLGDPFG